MPAVPQPCPRSNYPLRLCALEQTLLQLQQTSGHTPAHLTFNPGPNTWDDITQQGNVAPNIVGGGGGGSSPDTLYVADLAAKNAQVPSRVGQLLVMHSDFVNGPDSLWVATGITAGAWGLRCSSMSAQPANNVGITGGIIQGIQDLAVADGGTGASSAEAARLTLKTNAVSVPSVGSTYTIDWALSDRLAITMVTNDTVFSFSNMTDGLTINILLSVSNGHVPVWPGECLFSPYNPVVSISFFVQRLYRFTCIGGIPCAEVTYYGPVGD